jgi:hypothetical protein
MFMQSMVRSMALQLLPANRRATEESHTRFFYWVEMDGQTELIVPQQLDGNGWIIGWRSTLRRFASHRKSFR